MPVAKPAENPNMKTLSLLDFFGRVGYDHRKDLDAIRTICHLTKTRVSEDKQQSTLMAGTEQTFLIKAIAEWRLASSFFEIGTGRGTACYAMALVPGMATIDTVDILDFDRKFQTAIGFEPASVSLSDIRDMIPFTEKSKVRFHTRRELPQLAASLRQSVDLCFIDGDHTDRRIITEDYRACLEVVKEGGLILWDDYDPDNFAVKPVVDDLLRSHPEYDAILIEQRGHLFTDKPPEKERGVVIMQRGPIEV